MPLSSNIIINARKYLFLYHFAVRLRTMAFSKYLILARAAQLSEWLFLCSYMRFLNGFIPGPMLLSAQIKRSKYISLSLVFEKAFESFRMNNQKTQCEQCLRVDNSRSGYSGFLFSRLRDYRGPVVYIHSKREATNHLPFELSMEQHKSTGITDN